MNSFTSPVNSFLYNMEHPHQNVNENVAQPWKILA